MQKIGEHLDSGDDTSICAAPLTGGALRLLPCGGVGSAGPRPSCLAEAWSKGGGGVLELKQESLSSASLVLITVPLVSPPARNYPSPPAPCPLTPISSIQSSSASHLHSVTQFDSSVTFLQRATMQRV